MLEPCGRPSPSRASRTMATGQAAEQMFETELTEDGPGGSGDARSSLAIHTVGLQQGMPLT